MSFLVHQTMLLVLDLFYIQFLGNTFRFYTIYTYWTRNGIFILLPEHKAFISPEWVCGQGIEDSFCLASWEKRLLQPQDVVLDCAAPSLQHAGDRRIIWPPWGALATDSASNSLPPLSCKSPWFTNQEGCQWLFFMQFISFIAEIL